jgi:hypothetical protein
MFFPPAFAQLCPSHESNSAHSKTSTVPVRSFYKPNQSPKENEHEPYNILYMNQLSAQKKPHISLEIDWRRYRTGRNRPRRNRPGRNRTLRNRPTFKIFLKRYYFSVKVGLFLPIISKFHKVL